MTHHGGTENTEFFYEKIIIGWVICSLLGVLILSFLVQRLGNQIRSSAEKTEWSVSDKSAQSARLEKQRFYVNLIFFFLGAEVLGAGVLAIQSIIEKRKKTP